MSNTIYNTGEGKWTYGEKYQASSYLWDTRTLYGPCPACGCSTYSYGGGWACHAMYCRHSTGSFACSNGPAPTWWNSPVQVVKDGNSWCAHWSDFVDIQESDCAFGATPQEAVDNYLKLLATPAVIGTIHD